LTGEGRLQASVTQSRSAELDGRFANDGQTMSEKEYVVNLFNPVRHHFVVPDFVCFPMPEDCPSCRKLL